MKLSELLWNPAFKEKFVLQKFLCTFLHCSREELRTNMDKEISDEIIQKILVAYKSYVEDKKPLEYILGHVDFFGKEFFVNEATLIPRPETEYMINSVSEFISWKIEKLKDWKVENNILLDIWTGCGVLGISVLLQNPDYFAEAVFADYFANALEVAKKNYELLITNYEWKVQFLQADLLDFLLNKSSTLKGTPSFLKEDKIDNTVLVANLPYIPEETFEMNAADNVKKWEPKTAFVWGDDGLDYYRIMLDQIVSLNKSSTLKDTPSFFKEDKLMMFLEMMTWQVDVLRQEFDQYFVFEEVKTFHFNIRIVKAYLK
ncbi:MAG: protein-(glutamine-N5) methyltransferase, release factor-specific [uncultured bacterium (gcode 4)]|uniref:Protein-(Glutamine-N5) methyltransferase, release factor-specific n=1 Tax=uncultured bacterium (gcode 4) TaxID=1234023 RepID=K1XH95_9BACT|nr:MAG: protein-(glutamine-N5) methyltransferase, release factor-specific [uncultured bacterium (gcode 4)]